MNLTQHKITILKWVRSCETPEQLQLSLEAVDTFITKRFEGTVAPLELAMVEADLGQAIRDKQKEIIYSGIPTVLAPTLERYNHLNDVM